MTRAQSNVVGVVLLVGITTVALGLVAASAGQVVDSGAERADAARVADELADLVQPVRATGAREDRVVLGSGTLERAARDLRVLDGDEVLAERAVGALRYRRGGTTVTLLSGALLRTGTGATVRRPPPVRAANGLLVVNAAVLAGDPAYGGGRSGAVPLRVTVSHARTELGGSDFGVALETAAPDALAASFERRGFDVSRRDRDGDGVVSVVARAPNATEAILFTHTVEVTVGG